MGAGGVVGQEPPSARARRAGVRCRPGLPRLPPLPRAPSMAAVALLGRTANGWLKWKTEGGQTLDAVKRQAIEAESPKAS
ncbi:MAG: DUF4357 domain-containing protein [Pelomonas sp.]|nr:DUF4357 domain-containing protein [Roseateles sp.]